MKKCVPRPTGTVFSFVRIPRLRSPMLRKYAQIRFDWVLSMFFGNAVVSESRSLPVGYAIRLSELLFGSTRVLFNDALSMKRTSVHYLRGWHLEMPFPLFDAACLPTELARTRFSYDFGKLFTRNLFFKILLKGRTPLSSLEGPKIPIEVFWKCKGESPLLIKYFEEA